VYEQPEPILIAEGVRKVYCSGGEEVVALHGLACPYCTPFSVQTKL